MKNVVTIAIADDHPVLLAGITALLKTNDRFRILGEADSAEASLELARLTRPDVMIMDLSMPGDVFRTIGQIAASHPDTHILVFTAFCSVESALKALDAGATGFVLKGSPSAELIEAVDTVASGQMFVTRQYASQVMNGLRDRNRRQALQEAIKLNVREKQIIGHLLQARTNKEIAAELHISEKTVKHYMTGLMMKLKARNRVEVVIAARLNQEAQLQLQ
ncbi:response regulator [Devosia albogilva]|uniref:Response regulator n=1 Tax=Devosia albogilva TaxID=429726 RepID=A0ABW5QME1_9HYPH